MKYNNEKIEKLEIVAELYQLKLDNLEEKIKHIENLIDMKKQKQDDCDIAKMSEEHEEHTFIQT